MQLSIVTSLYQSESHLEEFHTRITLAARSITEDYEVIYVNDGSLDRSIHLAVKIHEQDPHVKVVDLSRNFGHHKAMMTGLKYSSGQLVLLLDSDLEEEPEVLEKFWPILQENAAVDVVFGYQKSRKGGWFERASGNAFYAMMRWLTDVDFPANQCVARLMRSSYVEALVSHEEREMMIAGLWAITGFVQVPVPIVKTGNSESTYTLRKRVSQAVDAITSFSVVPLRAFFWLGMFVSLVSFIAMFSLVLLYLLYGIEVPGWTSVMVSVWFIGGIIMLAIGVFGIYLSKIFTEVKRRPYTIVKRTWGVG